MVRSVGPGRAEEEARRLLRKHQITEPPVDPLDLAQREGLVVVFEQLPADTSSVLLREPSGRRLIGINSRHANTRRRFSAAHELGHAVLHFDAKPPTTTEAVVSRPLEVLYRDGLAGQGTDKVEIDANTYAASLLMPESMIKKSFAATWQRQPRRSITRLIEELASQFEVSEQAMRYRLINLGLVDPA